MIIFENLKLNRIKNPIGFQFDRLSFSFEVSKGIADVPDNLKIDISKDTSFQVMDHSQPVNIEKRTNIEVIDFKLEEQTRYYWRITDSENNDSLSEVALFETGLLNGFTADFLVTTKSAVHPVFFKDIELKKAIKEARLYITGLGLYEAYINDEKVGDEFLTPYCNDYDESIQYQTYEVTSLKKGKNRLEVSLGNGWYKGKFGIDQKENIFGDRFGMILELHIIYEDDEKEVIVSDRTWKARPSFITESSIYDGEVIDYQHDTKSYLAIEVDNDMKYRLKERISLPIKIKMILKPELIITEDGQQILDFKQNMVGFISFTETVKAGQIVKLSHGEVLQDGSFYRDNLRTAKAEFIIKGDGEKRTYRSHFTFYGFRYALVEGIDRVDPNNFKGCVIYSDLEETGYIETSDLLVNKLVENAKWGQRGNFLDVPIDCPQRDERLGWTADAQVFSRTASYNMDTLAFFNKYMIDLKNDQKRYGGGIPNYSPSFKESMEAGSVWGDAATIIPMNLYEFYGDKQLLAEHYPIMRTYIEYVYERDRKNGDNRLYDDGFHFGDWLSQDGVNPQSLKGATDDYYIASMYYYHSAMLVSEAAKILNKDEDREKYSTLASEIKKAILHEYFSPSGRLTIDTQTAYVLALYMGVYKNKDRIIEGMKARLKKDYYRIKSGFVGTPLMCKVLSENGMVEEAYRMLFEKDNPSWLYQVKLGATTIWERWNSVLPNGEISGTNMNSLNHYAYGSILEFLYANIAGLKPVKPGFKAVYIEPTPHFQLKEIKTTYRSASGSYYINWELRENQQFYITVSKPYSTEAVLKLPAFNSKLNVIEGEGEWLADDVIKLTSETFTCTYTMSEDYLRPYSTNSVILDLFKNAEAEKVFKEKAPHAYAFVTGENDEFLSFRLNEIAYLPMCFIQQSVLEDMNELLKAIKV